MGFFSTIGDSIAALARSIVTDTTYAQARNEVRRRREYRDRETQRKTGKPTPPRKGAPPRPPEPMRRRPPKQPEQRPSAPSDLSQWIDDTALDRHISETSRMAALEDVWEDSSVPDEVRREAFQRWWDMAERTFTGLESVDWSAFREKYRQVVGKDHHGH